MFQMKVDIMCAHLSLFLCPCISLRSAGGMYAMFLCDADQENMAFLCSPPPSGGQTVPGSTRDHSLHQ